MSFLLFMSFHLHIRSFLSTLQEVLFPPLFTSTQDSQPLMRSCFQIYTDLASSFRWRAGWLFCNDLVCSCSNLIFKAQCTFGGHFFHAILVILAHYAYNISHGDTYVWHCSMESLCNDFICPPCLCFLWRKGSWLWWAHINHP